MLESEIEKYLVKKIKDLGGKAYKFISPGNSGVPDRLVLLPGRIFFVELKAPGKEPRPLQVMQINKIKKLGQTVYVVDSKQKVDDLLNEIYTA